jgi:hypothetical protein
MMNDPCGSLSGGEVNSLSWKKYNVKVRPSDSYHNSPLVGFQMVVTCYYFQYLARSRLAHIFPAISYVGLMARFASE